MSDSTKNGWQHRAACRDIVSADFDPFFDGSEVGEQLALAICQVCPVRSECLHYAIVTGQEFGVWGGYPQRALRRLVDRNRRGRTRAEQTRHWNAAKTHCKHGHPFDETNTHYTSDGQRRCRTCQSEAFQRWTTGRWPA